MGQTNPYNRSEKNFADPNSFGPIAHRRRFRHPMAVFFHIFFKVSSILIYLFGSMFGQEFLGMFVALVFLISIDFWIVKNITGRLLVGLRWWNYIDDDGQSHWVFENRAAQAAASTAAGGSGVNPNLDIDFVLYSQENSDQVKAMSGRDATVFWISLFVAPILWFFFLISAIFSFNIHWVLFVAMALVLNGSNLYGYMRCRFGANYNYSSMIAQYVGPKMLFNMMKSGATQAAAAASASASASSASTTAASPQQQEPTSLST